MKISELTHEQCKIIADNCPEWLAYYHPSFMAEYRPTFMAVYREHWMDEHRPDKEIPEEIETLLRETETI